MIIELFLIGQLLAKRDSVDIPTVVGPKDYTDYDPQGTYGDKLPDAPKPIRPPTGYRYDVQVYKYLKG